MSATRGPHEQGDLFGGSTPESAGGTQSRRRAGTAPRSSSVRPAHVDDDLRRLAAALPQGVRFGTSSWSTPGWAGVVYADEHEVAQLARGGLGAYAAHPLLKAVGLDSTFYAPASAERLARYAAAVPLDFRFIVKAFSALTTPDDAPRPTHLTRTPAAFLDAAVAVRDSVEPIVAGLGTKLGTIVFQFSPLGRRIVRDPPAFASALHAFLSRLPRGPEYAVELRDRELLGPAYEQALRDANVGHCANVHPRMPPVDEQTSAQFDAVMSAAQRPLAIRWMLHSSKTYDSASRRYEPYDRIIDPDPDNRARIAALIAGACDAGRQVSAITNN